MDFIVMQKFSFDLVKGVSILKGSVGVLYFKIEEVLFDYPNQQAVLPMVSEYRRLLDPGNDIVSENSMADTDIGERHDEDVESIERDHKLVLFLRDDDLNV